MGNGQHLILITAAATVVLLAATAGFVYWRHTQQTGSKESAHASKIAAQSSSSPDFPASTAATRAGTGAATSAPRRSTSTVPTRPVNVPQLPHAGQIIPRGLQPSPPAAGSTAISYRRPDHTPLTSAQLVEWQPAGLTTQQAAAIAAIVKFMIYINRNDHAAAWHASTGRYDTKSAAYAAFDHGYRTSRFYQVAFGTPRQLAGDLVAVPLRFVSRQSGTAQGKASIPPCTFWPQYIYLVANRGSVWLPDDVPYYASRPEAAGLKRQGKTGLVLNPSQQESSC